MPSILYLDQSGQLGGAELMLAEIAKHVGNPAMVVLFDNGPFVGLLEKHGVRVQVEQASMKVTKSSGLWGAAKTLPTLFQQVRSIIRTARGFDLIYANTPKALVVGALAAAYLRKPLIYHLHDILDRSHFSSLNISVLTKLARNFATRVIANSQSTADAYIAAGGNGKTTDVIYNGFDPTDFIEDRNTERHSTRQNFGALPKHFVIMVVGRIARWKGQHVLLEAVRGKEKWIVWIVGDALFTQGDAEYKRELELAAASPELSGRVKFCGFQSNLAELYAAADVVVHCSTAPEPFGRVIVEGMLSGRPVIATNAGGAAEIVQSGVNGILVEPGNASELRSKLELLCESPALASSLSIAGRENALKRFSLGEILSQIRGTVEQSLN